MVAIPVTIKRNGQPVQPVLTVGARVRVKDTAPYMRGHIGTVEWVGHEIVEVRLDMQPDGHDERLWPFDKAELETLPGR